MSSNDLGNPVTTSSGEPVPPRPRPSAGVRLAIAAGAASLLGLGGFFYARARAETNHVALTSMAKPVTVLAASAGVFRPRRHYVATIEPWIEANVGPQFIAAYADTVLVRPGAVVKRGEVLATLDCRDANATQRAVAAEARAVAAKQKAQADEAARLNSLLDGGYVAPNEAEKKLAASESELADLMATQAKLADTSLVVDDCVLRAPFDGEIADRMVDPGAFVRRGAAIVSVVDRSTVRVTADVPEADYPFVAPGTPARISMLATGQKTAGTISRRSPAASDATRTVHFEIDLPDPNRQFPVGTTAELTIDVGEPKPATVIPSAAAAIRGDKAVVFVIEGDKAKKISVPVQGEDTGTLYLSTQLKPGTRVVTEGRSLLEDGDTVAATSRPNDSQSRASQSSGSAGGPRNPADRTEPR